LSAIKLLFTVFIKEMKDGMRDFRSVLCVGIAAIAVPLGLMWMFTSVSSASKNSGIKLPIVGSQFAPAFVDWLKKQEGIEVLPGPADPARAVREMEAELVLVIDKDFSENMTRGIPARVKLVSDSSRGFVQMKAASVAMLIQAYSVELTRSRLIALGVDPAVMTPLLLEEVTASGAQQFLASLLTILPMMLVMTALTGGMMIAIDATAGERERGSLEPLLLSPVARSILAAGKWLAASAFSSITLGIATCLMVFLVKRVRWDEMSVRFPLSNGDWISLLVLIVPLTLLINALMVLASTFARSFREAQGYMTFVVALTFVPGLFSTSDSLSNRPWLASIPVLGQFALATDVLNGKPASVPLHALAVITTLGCTFAILTLTGYMLKREKIIFGR
jgi:sodium transport system permease protein